MLTAKDIKGVYSIIPTPAKPVDGPWNGEDTVDHEETRRLVNAVIEDGSDGLILLGTTGECATVTEAEYRSFVHTVAEAVAKRIPLFVGATCLGTRETLRRIDYAQEQGADGALLGLPMWQACTEDMALRYYASISEARPDVAIMAYANPLAFRFDFPPSFWAKLIKQAPTVIAAKFMDVDIYAESVNAVEGKIALLPFPEMIREFENALPGSVTAIWATSSGMGPRPIVALMNALKRGDKERFEQIAADIHWTAEPMDKADGIFAAGEFGSYNAQFEKARFEASGYCRPGPGRPPYDSMPDHYLEDARENGRRWAEIAERYPRLEKTSATG